MASAASHLRIPMMIPSVDVDLLHVVWFFCLNNVKVLEIAHGRIILLRGIVKHEKINMALQHAYVDDVSAEPTSGKQWVRNGSNDNFGRTIP